MTIIRPLTGHDALNYRTLRQEILASRDAQYFSDSFERERGLTDKQWTDWCSEKRQHSILGAFDGTALVGIIMITGQGKNSPLAEMEAAWVHPRYRGQLGYRLYNAGLDWAKTKGGYHYVISFIRESANASTRLCKALGYIYAYTVENELWADGSVANTDAYIISLAGIDPNERKKSSAVDKTYIINLASQTLHAPTTVTVQSHALETLLSLDAERMAQASLIFEKPSKRNDGHAAA